MLYGFQRDDAKHLKSVARREGLRARAGQSVKYPEGVPDEGGAWEFARLSGSLAALGTATARRWDDIDGTMTDSGEDITITDRMLGAGVTIPTLTRITYETRGATNYLRSYWCEADTSSTVWGT